MTNNEKKSKREQKAINFDNPDLDAGMNTAAAAKFLGLSVRYLEGLRSAGGGPRFSPAPVRYTKRDCIEWQEARKVRSTSDRQEKAAV